MKGIEVSCGFLKLKWLFHLVWCVWCVPLLKWFCFKNSLFLRDFFFIFHLIRRIINFLIRNVLLALIILKRGWTSFFYLTFSTIYFASCVSNSTRQRSFSLVWQSSDHCVDIIALKSFCLPSILPMGLFVYWLIHRYDFHYWIYGLGTIYIRQQTNNRPEKRKKANAEKEKKTFFFFFFKWQTWKWRKFFTRIKTVTRFCIVFLCHFSFWFEYICVCVYIYVFYSFSLFSFVYEIIYELVNYNQYSLWPLTSCNTQHE